MFDYVVYLAFECLLSILSSTYCFNVWLISWYEYVYVVLNEGIILFEDGCTNTLCAETIDMHLNATGC